MDGLDRAERRPTLKERLGLKGLGCCGATWGSGPTTMSVRDDDGDDAAALSPEIDMVADAAEDAVEIDPPPPCAGMNLAAALAAERQLRAALESSEMGGSLFRLGRNGGEGRGITPVGTPGRVSLMRLLEETDGCDGEMKKKEEERDQFRYTSYYEGCDSVCCVCMVRKKGAAFIPCGHTFCRACSRELWLSRGSCPLCNRPILEILDIY
ncbi:uncharacterized protein LOC127247717 isoform X2 [Andrographis paniculata]|nr:uncharacterized protein LOC127247717 isoform X2 [Andrographis paniculata]